MELGNMIFGNSRGEVEVPRTKAFSSPWESFCAELNISCRGYPEEGCILPNDGNVIDTPTFTVRPYDWDAECDCGADAKMEAWFASHPHADNCYQSELRRRKIAAGWVGDVGGYLSAPVGKYSFDEEVKISEPLCRERGLPYPDGSAVHCDCGRDSGAEEYWETQIRGHRTDCRFVQPNFLFKPTGFRINWYKYPFRDSYMTPAVSPSEWRKILRTCIESVARA